jgi:hypothetical protein
MTSIFIEDAQGMVFAFASPGVVDCLHRRRVGKDFHLLEQIGHFLPGHNEGDDFAVPGYGRGFLFPALGGELRLPLGDSQRIFHR